MRALIFFILFTTISFSQNYKEKISVVQFSAEFAKAGELDLKQFKKYNIYYFDLEKNQKIFVQENITFVPTIILFQNGKEITRFEAGINFKLDPKCLKELSSEIDGLLRSQF